LTIRLPDLPPAKSCEKNPKTKWYEFTENKKWALEVFAFAILFASAVIYYRQMDAAQRQADANEKQLAEMQKESILDKRAWVFASTIETHPSATLPSNVVFQVIFKNTGKTPALNAEIWVSDLATENVNELQEIFTFPDKIIMPTGLLAPDGQCHSASPDTPESLIEKTKQGQLRLYIFGGVRYYDVVSKVQHWSQFCYQFNPWTRDFRSVQWSQYLLRRARK
jgi:hypothetical protein